MNTKYFQDPSGLTLKAVIMIGVHLFEVNKRMKYKFKTDEKNVHKDNFSLYIRA